MPAAIQAASDKSEEEPIPDLYQRRIRGPRGNVERLGCRTAAAKPRGRGAFRGVVDNATGRGGRRGRRRRSTGQVPVPRHGGRRATETRACAVAPASRRAPSTDV